MKPKSINKLHTQTWSEKAKVRFLIVFVAFNLCGSVTAQQQPLSKRELYLNEFASSAASALQKPGARILIAQSRFDEFVRSDDPMAVWQDAHYRPVAATGKPGELEALPASYLRSAGVAVLRPVNAVGVDSPTASMIYVQAPLPVFEMPPNDITVPYVRKPRSFFEHDDAVYLIIVVPGGKGEDTSSFPRVSEFVRLLRGQGVLTANNWFRLADPHAVYLIDHPGAKLPSLPQGLSAQIQAQFNARPSVDAISLDQIFLPYETLADLVALQKATRNKSSASLAQSVYGLKNNIKSAYGGRLFSELTKVR